ncbi:hypothetical protein AB5I41_25555 [Sphingomonas sp. MMS24-JH45]
MAFRAAALPGHFGVELDPAAIDAGDAATLAAGIARYRALRDRLHTGRTWLGEASDGIVWQAQGEPERLLLSVTRIAPTAQRFPPAVRLPMLLDAGPVRVRLLDLATADGHPPPQAPAFETLLSAMAVSSTAAPLRWPDCCFPR